MKINEILVSEKDKEFKIFQKIQPKIVNWTKNGINLWHFIYINDDPHQCIHMAGFSNNAKPKESNFEEVFNEIKRKHYSDLLLLVTFYGHMENNQLIKKINHPKIPIDALTALLFNDSSNGYLAYAHQIEQVFSTLTGSTSLEASQFRKNWNKKSHDVYELAKNIIYDKNLTLNEYIHENSFFDEGPFFLNGNFQQAKLLYESLMN